MAATRAFIVRPFHTQEGIDFDRVENELISPALERLGISGRTTGEITEQGNIREDMFRLLVISDLVIADVSIHNANVFYELGIRHGLQERHTLLIRAKETKAKYPFDLQTDRYLEYDPVAPAASLDALLKALRASLDSSNKDSPVFKLLPRLKPHDRSALMVVPWDFQEDVALAEKAQARGDLRMLADEASGFEWGSGGLRFVGEAQYRIRAFAGAKDTFEALRRLDPNSFLANRLLSTIYRKLGETAITADDRLACITRSEQAIDRVLERTRPPADGAESAAEGGERRSYRAEALALRGSNAKTRWFEDWAGTAGDDRRAKALRSPHLAESIGNYLDGYAEDLDSFYPGINAVALLRAQIELAKALPDVWEESFGDADDAARALKGAEARCGRIAAALELALGNDPAVARDGAQPDIWQAITVADLQFLTGAKPSKAAAEYRKALAGAKPAHVESARRNVELFRDLGLSTPSVEAALAEMLADGQAAKPQLARVVLFTGHMIDTAKRTKKGEPRFPPTPEAEAKARELIENALRDEMKLDGGVSLGIAGGACGGDILFHDVCFDLGIPTQLFLALPRPDFQAASVDHGGPKWVERYETLCDRVPPRVLGTSDELPRWLSGKKDYDIWQRNNFWMMFNTLALGPRRLTLLALFNPDREPDGAGGTGHLVKEAAKHGFKAVELDARKLLT